MFHYYCVELQALMRIYLAFLWQEMVKRAKICGILYHICSAVFFTLGRMKLKRGYLVIIDDAT